VAAAAPLSKTLTRPLELIGETLIDAVSELGLLLLFFMRVLTRMFRPPFRMHVLFSQLEFVGVGSLFIVLLTGTFTGAVFTLQSVDAFARFSAQSLVGATVTLALTRELAPVLTALMVAGRVGSAMATELGTMRVTEQIDAMEVMAVDPIGYLVAPRVFAGAFMVPLLTMLFILVGVVGSYLLAVGYSGIDEGAFIARIERWLDPADLFQGLSKALVFGTVVTLIGCYKGYNAAGGARGVGQATTGAVVLGSISIFVINYFMTALLL
jgi:phospholipid/cholesterol/gamma-HCH transport system permease protein